VRKIRNIAIILALLAVAVLTGYRFGQSEKTGGSVISSGLPFDLSLMNQVKARLESSYLDKNKIDDKKMMYGAIGGMVTSLDDPYTVFLSPSENKNANEDLAGEFGGVGISLGFKDQSLAVMTPLPKTPAERAGILAGDLILKITDKTKGIDQETNGLSLVEAVDLIRGKIGSEVTLKLFRDGNKQSFEVTLKRENIVVPSIELAWKEQSGKKVAWIKMYKFSELLYTEWPAMVDQIKAEKNKGNFGGIVLDLRNNPGGYLQASVMVASDFIKEGVVVKQESSNGQVDTYTVDKSRLGLLNDKMVVLINGGSASAAEILAGALRDHNRAKLVGEKSFGKGTVQQPEDFSDGSGLHVTIARWLLPSGGNIHKIGISPDVESIYEEPKISSNSASKTTTTLELPDNQLDKAIEVLLGK